jgi:hypothetical protein
MALIRLSAAVQRLNDEFGAGVTYWKVWKAATEGRIPSVSVEPSGRKYMDDADLPAVAEILREPPAKADADAA